jgi:hypothetical protein
VYSTPDSVYLHAAVGDNDDEEDSDDEGIYRPKDDEGNDEVDKELTL